MAHDYANKPKKRQPAARRATNQRSAAGRSAAKAKPLPQSGGRRRLLWAGLLSLLVVGAFGYGLYRLAFIQPDPAATQSSVNRQAAAPVQPADKRGGSGGKTAAAEDRSAEERDYRFYELLPKSEVVPPTVEAYKSTPKSAKNHSRYLLQAGSFRDPADADTLRAKLILMGLPNVTSSKVVSSSGSVWYRVRVGPFSSRSKLNKAQDQLVRMNLQPMQVKLP